MSGKLEQVLGNFESVLKALSALEGNSSKLKEEIT
jgi:hypothetical protein